MVFTLEYWIDDDWHIGRLKEVPGVFSQGENLKELEDNIREAYSLMLEDEIEPIMEGRQIKQIEVAVRKRHESLQELVEAGCCFKRHGRGHDIIQIPQMGRKRPFHNITKSRTLCDLIRRTSGPSGR